MLFDTHTHLDDEKFDTDREEVIASLKDEGVSLCVNIGANIESSKASIALAEQYDFIYADPPYDLPTLPTIPDIIFEQGLLKQGGYFVLEHSKAHDFYQHPHFVEQRTYGSVHFTFFQ